MAYYIYRLQTTAQSSSASPSHPFTAYGVDIMEDRWRSPTLRHPQLLVDCCRATAWQYLCYHSLWSYLIFL